MRAVKELESKWLEGPNWLKAPEHHWPKSEINCDEAIVMAEKRNLIVSNVVHELKTPIYFTSVSRGKSSG